MTTEFLQITDSGTPDKPCIRIYMRGDHETTSPEEPATLAYLVSAAMWQLFKDGTVIAKLNEVYGLNLTGAVTVENEE